MTDKGIRVNTPIYIDDSIFKTGTFFGVKVKLKPFMRSAISMGLSVRFEMFLTHLSLCTKFVELTLLFPFI